MRAWYLFHKFIGGVLVGMICGVIAALLLVTTAVVCYLVMS